MPTLSPAAGGATAVLIKTPKFPIPFIPFVAAGLLAFGDMLPEGKRNSGSGTATTALRRARSSTVEQGPYKAKVLGSIPSAPKMVLTIHLPEV